MSDDDYEINRRASARPARARAWAGVWLLPLTRVSDAALGELGGAIVHTPASTSSTPLLAPTGARASSGNVRLSSSVESRRSVRTRPWNGWRRGGVLRA
jgi:hypothetical protein